MDLNLLIEQFEANNISMLIKPKKPFILIRLIYINEKNRMIINEKYLNTFEVNNKKITETIIELKENLSKLISEEKQKSNKNIY